MLTLYRACLALALFGVGVLLLLPENHTVKAQSSFNASQNYCIVRGPPDSWAPCDVTNPLVVATGTSATTGASVTSTAALAANLVVKASAGTLYAFQAAGDTTLSGAAWWVMLYNATTAPADGAVTPYKCYGVPSGTVTASFGWATGIAFGTGITMGVSTTGCFTKTESTHAFLSGDYK